MSSMQQHYAQNYLFADVHYLIDVHVTSLEALTLEFRSLKEIKVKIKDRCHIIEEKLKSMEDGTQIDSKLSEERAVLCNELLAEKADFEIVHQKSSICEDNIRSKLTDLNILIQSALKIQNSLGSESTVV